VDLPDICFAATRFVACIAVAKPLRPCIVINSVFNHAQLPLEVALTMIKHELIHLAVPPLMINARRISHPPEFWETERKVSPACGRTWAYIDWNLWGGLLRLPEDDRNERLTLVDPRYARGRRNQAFWPIEECLARSEGRFDGSGIYGLLGSGPNPLAPLPLSSASSAGS